MITVSIGPDYPTRELTLEQALAVAADLHQQGQLDRAAAAYQSILAGVADQFDALDKLAVVELQRGRVPPAIELLRQATTAHPSRQAGWIHLGQAQRQAGDISAAKAAFNQALSLAGDPSPAHNGLGAIAQQQGDWHRAAQHFRAALTANTGHAAARANLAAALLQAGDLSGAIENARIAAQVLPGSGAVHKCLGTALATSGDLEPALSILEKACQLQPADPDAHYQRACTLESLGRWDAALAAQQQALDLRPDFPPANAAALFLARRLCRWDLTGALAERLQADIEADKPGVTPFVSLSEWTTPAQQRRCAQRWADDIAASVTPMPAARLSASAVPTVGYLSNGFGQHPTACLTAEYFEQHDASAVRTLGYSVGPDDGSDLRRRIVNAMAGFRELAGRPYPEIARRIRDDGVDILVDLRGFGGGAVSEVLAMRPAPIQVNWLAYPGTMGRRFMDYIVIDPFVVPEDQWSHLGETPVVLPHAYQPNDTTRETASIRVSRGDCGLPESGPVYCSFNNSYKFSEPMFETWMEILAAVPGSVLWLLDGKAGTSTADHLRQAARSRGIGPERLVFMPKLPHQDYLARYAFADLFLDTLPYNAHTTASDALWAGCPVLTAPGETFASRVAGSLVRQAGLPELVCRDLADYRERAIALGRDPAGLRTLRHRLADQRPSAPLFQIQRFCRHMEQAFHTMLDQHRAGTVSPIRISSG